MTAFRTNIKPKSGFTSPEAGAGPAGVAVPSVGYRALEEGLSTPDSAAILGLFGSETQDSRSVTTPVVGPSAYLVSGNIPDNREAYRSLELTAG